MTLSVDPAELLAAQRTLRDRLLGAETAAAMKPMRELAAEMLLYIEQPRLCWEVCMAWLLEMTSADRIDAGFAASHDAHYRPMFERVRKGADMPSLLGASMNARDPGVAAVWSTPHVVVYPDVECDQRLGPDIRAALLAAATRRKLAVALRDAGRDVGLICVDGDSSSRPWTSAECLLLDTVAREVIGPILGASQRLGGADAPHEFGVRAAAFVAQGAQGELTPAELRVARLVVDGFSYKEMARRLGRSAATIDHQLRSLRSKLGVNSTAKLVRALAAVLPPLS